MNLSMEIRKANVLDANNIAQLAQSIQLNLTNPQQSGFLVYTHPAEEYARRIAMTDFFYVAEESGDIVGYLMCYDYPTLQQLTSLANLNYED